MSDAVIAPQITNPDGGLPEGSGSPLDIESARMFVSLLETGSFSRTAEALYMAQSTVSQRLRQLEDELGAALIVRGGRTLTLTAAGEVFYPRARDLVRTFDAGREELRTFVDRIEGTVRVWASQTAGGYILPPSLCAFASAHAGVSVRLHIANSSEVERALLEGNADFGVVESPSTSGHLVAQDWLEDPLVFVCAPGHPLAEVPGEIPLASLGSSLLAVREPGSGTRDTLLAALEQAGSLTGLRWVEMSSLAAVRSGVAAGAAVTFLSRWVVADDLAAGRLVSKAVAGLRPSRRMRLVRRRGAFPSHAAERLFEDVWRHGSASAEVRPM